MELNEMRIEISRLIKEKGPPRLIDHLEHSIKESFVLRTSPSSEEKISTGSSKIGGTPDLPKDFDWPSWNSKPLGFIAQTNLRELTSDKLPNQGLLSFFYSAEQETWGFDPNDQGSWKILHFEDDVLSRRSFPTDLSNDGKYNNCSVEFIKSFNLPAFESPYFDIDYDSNNRKELDQIFDLLDSLDDLLNLGSCIHRLLGHPDQIQGDMMLEAQLASNGIYCGDLSSLNNPRRKELEPGAIDWELILQIDSDDNAGMMWGDVGRIYFLMTDEDIRNKDFDKAWMIFQCS